MRKCKLEPTAAQNVRKRVRIARALERTDAEGVDDVATARASARAAESDARLATSKKPKHNFRLTAHQFDVVALNEHTWLRATVVAYKKRLPTTRS